MHSRRCALVIVLLLLRWPDIAAAGSPALPGVPLVVRLTAVDTLPATVRTVLMREVERIWSSAGIAVQWAGAADAGARRTVRVLVVSRTDATDDAPSADWPVAELLRPAGREPMAVAAVEAAVRVVRAAGHAGEPDALAARRLGVVLGRAIAHEVGHALLASGAHASHGLMRARIDAGDFADLRDGGFAIDAAAAARIRTSLGETTPPASRVASWPLRR